jgi:hypothetical protein
MNENELLLEYAKIENKFQPIVEVLDQKKNDHNYLKRYKGITTIKSPLVYKPKVLFIGINEGQGRYKELNNGNSNEIKYPKRMLGEGNDNSCFKTNNWFEKNNAFGGWNNEKDWIKYNWYQTDKKVNNIFTANSIDLLCRLAELIYPEEHKKSPITTNKEPFWFEDINKSIMVTNLYPISTENTGDLNKICTYLSKEPSLKEFWAKEFPNKKINSWLVRIFFIRRVNELIALINPQVIVCMGTTTFKDFTYGKMKVNKKKIFETNHTISDKEYPVIGFSRSGNWSHLMPKLAELIFSKL